MIYESVLHSVLMAGVWAMKILLINDNPIVAEFLGKIAEKMSIDLHIERDVTRVDFEAYELVCVDDGISGYEELIEKLRKREGGVVLFSSGMRSDVSSVETISKPFLPEDMEKCIKSYLERVEKGGVVFDEGEEMRKGAVLDPEEIDLIRNILDGEDMQMKDGYGDFPSGENVERVKMDIDELIGLIKGLKLKKLRKLLKGAEIELSIKFPKERE